MQNTKMQKHRKYYIKQSKGKYSDCYRILDYWVEEKVVQTSFIV